MLQSLRLSLDARKKANGTRKSGSSHLPNCWDRNCGVSDSRVADNEIAAGIFVLERPEEVRGGMTLFPSQPSGLAIAVCDEHVITRYGNGIGRRQEMARGT
jgi:hypothetical protein